MDPALALEVKALSCTKSIDEATRPGDSDVQKFYYNTSVLITGATGFLGKQIVEKLLRSCQISKMYILVRSKKGKPIKQRLSEMMQDPVFETVRQQKPDFASKIIGVEGDISDLKLGLSQSDYNTLTEQVNIIIHVAATTRFDESLRLATLINVRGTREVLSLGAACKSLKSYVHVSTAYSHATSDLIGQEVSEKFYDSPVAPEILISLAENMDDERLEGITPNLISKWPNTYTFTKAVGEELVRSSSQGLPICIVRPAIVIGAYREPSPGWIDISAIYGATGIIVSVGLGINHVQLSRSHIKLSLIPCDYVTNTVLVAARESAVTQNKGGNYTKIYTVATANRNTLTWGNLSKVLSEEGPKYATPKSIYYAYGFCTSNKYIYLLTAFLLHFIPAFLADLVCFVIGKERRFVKIAKKMTKMTDALSYFMTNDWLFNDTNTEKLYINQSERDKIIFNFNVKTIDWRECACIWYIGARKYIMKDGLKNTSYAVKKQFYLGVLHYCFCFIFIYLFYRILCVVF